MSARPDVIHDPARLQEIADLGLVSGDDDPALRAFAERAAAELGLGIGLVSIVLDGAQMFAAAHGLEGWLADVNGTPVEWSFCQHAVREAAPLIVEDARADGRVAASPLVTEDGVRCYAGVPLVTSAGHALGTLCVIGTSARTITADEVAALRRIGDEVVSYLESRRGTRA